jgi:hypothetical protein
MKTVKNLDALRRMALAKGGELIVGGKPFNSTRQVVKAKSRQAAEPAKEAPKETPKAPQIQAAEPALTRADMAKMLDERDSILRQDIQHLHMLLAQVLASQQGAKPQAPTSWRFEVEQDAQGAIKSLVAKPAEPPPPAAAIDADGWSD